MLAPPASRRRGSSWLTDRSRRSCPPSAQSARRLTVEVFQQPAKVAPEPMIDFGGKLRQARERRGISLRQIAASTKISVAALEALERNDVSKLPGGIFSRAFVRSYAVEVGLDPDETVQEFIAQFPDSIAASHTRADQIEDHQSVESERRMASTFLALVAVSVPI